MNNIYLILHIIFGSLTACLAARYSPGKPLGLWGYSIGAIGGLVGGLAFLVLFRPGDIIGSIIAAMFTSLLAVFVLRLAETSGISSPKLAPMPRKQPPEPTHTNQEPAQKKSPFPNPESGIFNFFDGNEAQQENTALPTAFSKPKEAPIGYDSEMFGRGVNSLQGDSLFDTDDEIPNVPNEVTTYQDIAARHKPTQNLRPANLINPDNRKANDMVSPEPSNERPSMKTPAVANEPYAFLDDADLDMTVYTELNFNETGMSELGTVDDVYGANYVYDSAPGIGAVTPSTPTLPSQASKSVDSISELPAQENPLPSIEPAAELPVESLGVPAQLEPIPIEQPTISQNVADHNGAELTTVDRNEDELTTSKLITSKLQISDPAALATEAVGPPAQDVLPEEPRIESVGPLVEVAEPVAELAAEPVAEPIEGIDSRELGVVAGNAVAESTSGIAVNPPDEAPVYDYPDDLTKIKGVDKIYAQRLHAMGIHTWSQVADTEPPLLKDWVAADSMSNVSAWPQLARSLAVAHDRVGATYHGPTPDDLTEIIGMTKKLIHSLNRKGIVSYQQLVDVDADAFIRQMAPEKVTAAAIYDWIGQAKQKLK